jgi:regulatory protein
MRITSIRKRRSDVEISFEDQSKIILGYKVVIDNGLRRNDDLNDEGIKELLMQTEKLKIKDSAFRLLGRRAHSVFELTQKLTIKSFHKDLIDSVISDLKKNNYLNDDDFALAYAAERLSKRKSGINKIKSELIKKGVNRKSIELVLSEVDNSKSETTALELAQKKFMSLTKNENDRRKIKQKIFSFLFSKGFETDTILKVVNQLKLDEDNFNDL